MSRHATLSKDFSTNGIIYNIHCRVPTTDMIVIVFDIVFIISSIGITMLSINETKLHKDDFHRFK